MEKTQREREEKNQNGRAERAASTGKLYNECRSLATVMDESGMVFVMSRILLEWRCCFPVPSLCELNRAAFRSVAVIRPLTLDELTIKGAEHMHTCMTLCHC